MAKQQSPADVQAELLLLSAIIINNDILDDLDGNLRPDYFYRPEHQLVYGAMLEIHGRGDAIDETTLFQHFSKSGQLERIGGINFLVQLANTAPTAANYKTHLRAIKQKYEYRAMQDAFRIAASSAAAEDDTPENIRIALQSRLDALDANADIVLPTYHTYLKPIYDNYASQNTQVKTGFAPLDDRIGGLYPKDLILAIARPGNGKTTFTLQLLINVVFKQDKKVLYLSAEMSGDQIQQKVLANVGGMNSRKFRLSGKEAQMEKMKEKTEAIESSPEMEHLNKNSVIIGSDILSHMSVPYIRAVIRRAKQPVKRDKNGYRRTDAGGIGGVDLVIIDQIDWFDELRNAANAYEDRTIRGKISKGLLKIARDENIPILLNSQCNRDSDKRSKSVDRHPRMSDIKGSSELEADAVTILGLYCPGSEDPVNPGESDKYGALLEVEAIKDRLGATGRVALAWDKGLSRITALGDDMQAKYKKWDKQRQKIYAQIDRMHNVYTSQNVVQPTLTQAAEKPMSLSDRYKFTTVTPASSAPTASAAPKSAEPAKTAVDTVTADNNDSADWLDDTQLTNDPTADFYSIYQPPTDDDIYGFEEGDDDADNDSNDADN